MKLTLTLHGVTHSVESDTDYHTIDELVEHFRGMLVSAGFHPECVVHHFDSDYDWNFAQSEQPEPQCCSKVFEDS